MAKIYTVSDQVQTPELKMPFNFNEYNKSIEEYKKEVERVIRATFKSTPDTGTIIRFGVADGYAEYMIISVKDATMVHLEHADAYRFQFDYKLGSSEIKNQLKMERSFKKLFQ